MIKPEPPKPPPMREIRDDASYLVAGYAMILAPVVLIAIPLIKAFSS